MTEPCVDYYERTLASPAYLASRASKAALVANVCRDRLDAAGLIVDMGCGSGLIKAELERQFDRPILGLELNASLLRTKAYVAAGDLTAMPLPDCVVDFAICNHVYEHVADQPRFFRELIRVLAPQGAVYFTAGSKYSLVEPHYRLPLLSWLPAVAADRYLKITGRGRSYRGIRFAGGRKLRAMLNEAGFEVEDITREVILGNKPSIRSRLHRGAYALLERLPAGLASRLLRHASPQWFLLLRKQVDRRKNEAPS